MDCALKPSRTIAPFSERSESCHPLNKKLFSLMEEKKTNLCVAADVTTSKQLLELADEVGPYICILKLHVDILDSFSDETEKELVKIAHKHNFLLFEDRKFVDIGNTVGAQYRKVASWADLVTIAPAYAGDGMIKAIQNVNEELDLTGQRGAIIIAEMSTSTAMKSSQYISDCVKMSENYPNTVIGFVCQSHITDNGSLLQFTPGVNNSAASDNLGQCFTSPTQAILNKYADVIIVGRGVYKSAAPAEEAKKYSSEAYSAYLKRTNQEKN